MRITVLGSGTSTGVPTIGCGCEVCRSDKPENRRLRSSLYVENGADAFLVDCSTDFREQALRHRLPRVDAVLMTHDHADHLNGIDDLRIFNFLQSGAIDVLGEEEVLETIRRRFDYCFSPKQIGGGVPQLNLRRIEPDKPFSLCGVEILPLRIKHGILDILGFRIGSRFAYLTDCSGAVERTIEALRGIEILIVGALRPSPTHPTHFTLGQALDFRSQIGARQTWFTHLGCQMGDHFQTNASLPADAQLLHDGQIIEID
ncbi:MBL fold metallo-hydrolase [Candidatus Sumerlaeota bacterium]|nr:MBL fold metallo-hydrolase [Candidatus Sumerlaeota bacterium]